MIRKMLIPNGELRRMLDDGFKWASKGLETGGYVFGRVHPNGLGEVVRVVDGGPKAQRSPMSFSGDNEYASEVMERLKDEDPGIRLLGEYHLHPWHGPARLSEGDLRQLLEVKRLRPWFTVTLLTADQLRVWDVDAGEGGLRVREVPYQIVGSKLEKGRLLDRILRITRHDVLVEKTALIVGLGSGGSVVAKYLGCTGIGRIVLVDNEELEAPNLIRHEGGLDDLGEPKVEICKRIVESHNPFTIVEAHRFDAVKEAGRLERLASQADLIVGSSGSPRVNHLLNRMSVEMGIPAVYGGVYERASGGFVLAVNPGKTACFNCLFGLTSRSYSVDREAAKRYGLDEDELHAQQGLWIDVSIPALILCKVALSMLEGRSLGYDLVLYDSGLELRKLKVKPREDCAVCNEEGWVRKLSEAKPVNNDLRLRDRLRRLLKWRR